jgi:hypothetical protein
LGFVFIGAATKSMNLRNKFFILLTIGVFLVGQWGCAFNSAQPTQDPNQLASLGLLEEVRMQAGTVRVFAPAFLPEAKLEMPPGGVMGGFGWGVKRGVAIGNLPWAAIAESTRPWVFHPMAVAGYIVGAVIGVVLVGPYGAIASESQAKVQEAKETLKKATAPLQLQETLREHVVKQIRQRAPDLSIVSTERDSTEGQRDLHDEALKYKHVTTFLEPRVVSYGLAHQGLGVNPPLAMFMQVDVKVTRLADRALLFDNSFQYKSQPRPYNDWAEDSGQNFIEAINMAYRDLAEQIVFVLR